MSVSLDSCREANLAILSLAAALFAVALAWQLNLALARLPGTYRVYLAPLSEEAAKTCTAVYTGASLFFTHALFGAAEAAWELLSQRRNGFYAGMAALASHSIFGIISVSVFELYDATLPALVAGYLAHTAWNFIVATMVNSGRKH
ncbi:MAG: hypothetical protein A4E55_00592 [Pelotomaculum sp. PtaU1.Bin035]|nr:MAG: hypothetical protein A4E55_00592 [Pelotomaculum sp. PtaU1.Bin035]